MKIIKRIITYHLEMSSKDLKRAENIESAIKRLKKRRGEQQACSGYSQKGVLIGGRSFVFAAN